MNVFNCEKLGPSDLGYLAGMYFGDGYAAYNKKDRHYVVEYFLNSKKDEDIKEHIKRLLTSVGLTPFEMKDKRYNSTKIKINSKRFFEHITEEEANFENIENRDKTYQKGFLAGFIDAEGYVTKGEIVITQKDKAVLGKIAQICEKLGVIIKKIWSFKNYKTPNIIWRMRISTKSRKIFSQYSIKIKRVYGGDTPKP